MIHRDNSNTQRTYTQSYQSNPHKSEGDAARSLASTGAEAGPILSPVQDTLSILQEYMDEAARVFGLNGLEVLRANPSREPTRQHGWKEIYIKQETLNISKRYKTIQGIRKTRSIEQRIWLLEHNIIDQNDVYAWFYDLVWRQNNNHIILKDPSGTKVIEDLHGRWNKKRPFGYQVRKRLKGVLEQVQSPKMLTLTVSDRNIPLPENTNIDPVICSILSIGKWVSAFNTRLWKYQKKQGIDWQFKGWALQFQGEKDDTTDKGYYNRGFPHIHEILSGNWIGRINDIQELWPYGSVDLTTEKDVQRKYPGRPVSSLRVANYLTKYVSKAGAGLNPEKGIHKGYAWLAFGGGRVFSVAHSREKRSQEAL